MEQPLARRGGFQAVLQAVGTLSVALLLLASGFLACVLPPTAKTLALQTAQPDARTAFTVNDLANVADATRDYSFGSHDRVSLVHTIAVANHNAQERGKATGKAQIGAPNLDGVDIDNQQQVEAAFAHATERYVYSDDAISHLDDCYSVAMIAYTLVAVALIFAVASLAAMRSRVGAARALTRAGTSIVALFAVAGIWAAIDFDGLFTVFHELFFSQGNWTFASDSLLICALPTEFWVGMGAVWLTTSTIASILSILVGKSLTKPRSARQASTNR